MKNISNRASFLVGGIVLAGAVFLFLRIRGCERRQDANNSTEILAPNESAKVIVDPHQRKITLVMPGHSQTLTLPNRPSVISVLKDDGIKIKSPQWGTAFSPFMTGLFTLNGGKLGGGVSIFYYKRADLNLGFAINPQYVQDTTAFVGVSAFIYSNTSLILAIDNQTIPMIGLTVRF